MRINMERFHTENNEGSYKGGGGTQRFDGTPVCSRGRACFRVRSRYLRGTPAVFGPAPAVCGATTEARQHADTWLRCDAPRDARRPTRLAPWCAPRVHRRAAASSRSWEAHTRRRRHRGSTSLVPIRAAGPRPPPPSPWTGPACGLPAGRGAPNIPPTSEQCRCTVMACWLCRCLTWADFVWSGTVSRGLLRITGVLNVSR